MPEPFLSPQTDAAEYLLIYKKAPEIEIPGEF